MIACVFAGASTPAIWLIALGAWLAIRLGAIDGLVGLQTAGNHVFSHLGTAAAFVSAAALAATMGMNAYGGMLTTLAGVDSFRKVAPTRRARVITILVLTVIWFVIAKADHHQRGGRRRHGLDAHALPARAVDDDRT